jgi:hypothetical protein
MLEGIEPRLMLSAALNFTMKRVAVPESPADPKRDCTPRLTAARTRPSRTELCERVTQEIRLDALETCRSGGLALFASRVWLLSIQ